MSTVPRPRGKLNAHHSTGAAGMCPRAKQTPWEHVTMSTLHAEPPEEHGPRTLGVQTCLGRSHGNKSLPSSMHGAKASLSMCPEAEREQLQPGWTDGWTRGGDRGNPAVTPRTPVPARGGGVLSISWPAEPSHPKNLPQHHRLPKDRGRTTRRISAPKFGGQWGGEGTAVGEDTHLRCIQGPSRIRAARPQPSIQPAGPRGGTLPYHQAKIPPTSLPLLLPSPEEGNSPPHRCPVYQELVPSTRENSRSISRPCFHSADTHYL